MKKFTSQNLEEEMENLFLLMNGCLSILAKTIRIRIGLDFHGVIDKNRELYSKLSNLLVDSGYEVHIITGSMWKKKIEKQLRDFNIKWTHHFSISDYLIENR